MKFPVTVFLALIVLTAKCPAAAGSSIQPAAHILQTSSAASGGERLKQFGALTLTGRATRFGLSGRYSEVDEFRSGWFRLEVDYGISSAAEGFNSRGRWRMDASRRAHPLDSIEAKTVAVTESYLARRGYLRPDSSHDAVIGASSATQDSRYDIVAVTPRGGRTAWLWIARADHLVHRIDVRLAERTKTIRYGDYRDVHGVEVPFSIIVDDGDEADAANIAVSSYHFLPRVSPAAFVPPTENLADARLGTGHVARLALRDDSATSGFAVVFVTMNGNEPLPFIVDTGGHDIVTPAVARQLRLKVIGGGATSGAGAGSTRIAFTRVKSVSLGEAEMFDQPFVVLYEDLGSALDAYGHKVPIAGILGLELFERFTITLDFMKGDLELRPRFVTLVTGKTVLPVTFTGDEPLVNAQIDGRSGSFAVDTGNNVGLILYHRWLAKSNVPGLQILPATMDGTSVGGMVSFQHAHADSLSLGTLRITDVPVLISDAHTGSLSSRSEAGSIGIPNLAELRITFQYSAGKMIVDR